MRVPPYLNQAYRQKKELLAKAEADGDWGHTFSSMRSHIVSTLWNCAQRKGLSHNPSEFWGLVGEFWQDSENTHENLRKVEKIMAESIGRSAACMSPEDRLIFKLLP